MAEDVIVLHRISALSEGLWEVSGPGVSKRLFMLSEQAAQKQAASLDKRFLAFMQNRDDLNAWAEDVRAHAQVVAERAKTLAQDHWMSPCVVAQDLAELHEQMQYLAARRIGDDEF